MPTVTQEYLMGIRDAREYLNRFEPGLEEMRQNRQNCIDTMREFSTGPVKDHLTGERDFWANQIRKEISR